MTRKKTFTKTLEDLEKLPEAKRERAKSLYEKLTFMDAELTNLQNIIKKNGWTETYQNGANQCGIKKATEGDVYNTMIKNYNATMKVLDEMLSSAPEEVDDIEAKYFG